MKEKFSLKDALFNEKKITYISSLISSVYPLFKKTEFEKRVLGKFPELELKQRIVWIRENLKKFLPNDFYEAVEILLQSLPAECDADKTDDDFGDFIFAPYNDFIAAYGCKESNLEFSLCALKEMTKRFSAEDAIRYFIVAFPEKTLQTIVSWSFDTNYHVRRLASEGTRPKLPWSQKLELDNSEIITSILTNLYTDKTRYVVRSVANHMNDISKIDENLVIETLKKWRTENTKQSEFFDEKEKNRREIEMKYLVSHSLRTLVKKGNVSALEMLGYNPTPAITVSNFTILNTKVRVGESVMFSFMLHAEKEENLMIDYSIGFQGKKSKETGVLFPKVFKLKKTIIKPEESLAVSKKHPLRVMTTKKLYAGEHTISLQINGKLFGEKSFTLEV